MTNWAIARLRSDYSARQSRLTISKKAGLHRALQKEKYHFWIFVRLSQAQKKSVCILCQLLPFFSFVQSHFAIDFPTFFNLKLNSIILIAPKFIKNHHFFSGLRLLFPFHLLFYFIYLFIFFFSSMPGVRPWKKLANFEVCDLFVCFCLSCFVGFFLYVFIFLNFLETKRAKGPFIQM